MSGEYSILIQDVKSAFADFKDDKTRLSHTVHLNYLDILEKNILYFISVYRKSEIEFVYDLIKKLEAH